MLLPMPTVSAAHSVTTVETYSKIYWALDYVPIVSTGKQIVDLFFSRCWRPSAYALDRVPSFVYAYHQHLIYKDDFRYISIIPVLGNLVLIIKDVYQELTADVYRQEHSEPALEEIIEGCLAAHNQYRINYRFEHQDCAGKLAISRLLTQHAERGNEYAYEYLQDRRIFGDPDCYYFIMGWLVSRMQNFPDIRIGNRTLQQSLTRAYQEGNSDQQAILLSRATRIAEAGRRDFMYLVHKFYLIEGDRISAMAWLERAAQAGLDLAIIDLNWWREQLPPDPPPIPAPIPPVPQPVRPEDFVGTVPYDLNNIPAEIQTKADEITALIERFENLPDDVAEGIAVPEGYRCPISQEFMAIPIFDCSHPGINADNIANRNLRHLFDKTSLERVYAARVTLNCPTCRYPENERTDHANLRIDTALQDEILEFLRRNVPAPVV